ncbi:MAG: hypothetical protein U9O64_03700 [Campylobacterota bacterium]|nr:hypothetical protein [Campylobacterota bacterium]
MTIFINFILSLVGMGIIFWLTTKEKSFSIPFGIIFIAINSSIASHYIGYYATLIVLCLYLILSILENRED